MPAISVKKVGDALGAEINGVDLLASEQFADVLRADVAKWGKIIRDAGVRAD